MLTAATTGSAYWYLARGTGVVSLLLLTAALVLGIANGMRWRSDRWPAFVVTGLHRNLTLVAVAFVAVHVLTNVADGYAPIRLVDAVVPFVSAYRPVWLGFGALAFDLLLALIVTSLLRRRIGHRRWKAIHWLAYAAWPVALVHGIGAGTDVRSRWLLVLTFACVGVVLLAVLWRLAGGSEGAWTGRRAAGALGVLALPVALFAWMHGAPLQRGWAARAGTPSALIGRTRGVAQTASATVVPSSFTADLNGTIAETAAGDGGASVTIDGALSGGFDGRLRLVLVGQPLEGGGLRMTSSTVALGPPAQSSELTGSVTRLEGTSVLADLADAAGHHLRLGLELRIDAPRRVVYGRVRAAPLA